MTMLKIFTVYDSKAQFYSNPFYSRTTNEAIRSFEQAANDIQSTICMHAADFTLFEIGRFDEFKCEIELLPAKVSLAVAIELKRQ